MSEKRTRAGELRHMVTLQSPAGTRNPNTGERTTTWTDVAAIFALIEPVQGQEQFLAAQRQASTTHRIKIRYSSEVAGVTAAWRFLFGTRVFTIDEPPRNVGEKNDHLEMLCTEGPRKE